MRIAALIMLAACTATLAGCGGDQSALDAHGPSAVHLKHLIIWIVAICSVVWAAVMMALIWALFRHRTEDYR